MNKELLEYIVSKKHHKYRQNDMTENLAEEYHRLGLSPVERMTRRFELLTERELPVLLPNEKICFMRTVKTIPDCFTEEEWAEIKSKHYIHELGYMSNLSPDYEQALSAGLLELRKNADEYGKRAIDAIIRLSDRYRAEAEKQGKTELAHVLEQVPRYGAR